MSREGWRVYHQRSGRVTIQRFDGSEETLTMTQKWPIRSGGGPTAKAVPGHKAADNRSAYSDTTLFPGKGAERRQSREVSVPKDHDPTRSQNGPTLNIIIYIGCGERGNEMTQVLEEFF